MCIRGRLVEGAGGQLLPPPAATGATGAKPRLISSQESGREATAPLLPPPAAMEVAELERGFVNEAPVVLISTWPNHEFHLVGIPGGLAWTQFSLLTGKHRAIRRIIVTTGQ